MRVVELRDEADFQAFESAWDKLLCDSASNTIFLSWEWISAWWSSYGTPGQLRILAAFDERGALLGIAPLRCHTLRKYGQRVEALSFLGDGSDDSDYLDLLVAKGHEKEVVAAFCAHLAPELKRGTVLLLNEIPESSPHLSFLRNEFERRLGMVWSETDVDCGTASLPASWEEYLGKLRPRFRTKIRSTLRNLETREEIQFGFCEKSEQLESLLPALFDLHARRWAQDGKPGVFGRPGKRDFYVALSRRLLERGWLRFSWLKWKDRILACQYGFAYENTYFHLQEGYEPASEHWNLGIGLRAWSIRQFLKEGLREYDFLAGLGRHKSDWGAERKQSKRLLMANLSHKNVLFCRGPGWEARGRESLKRIVPENILIARHAQLEKQRLAMLKGRATRGEQSGSEWVRELAANCYVHLRIPALMRGLRGRYQLSISRNGRMPNIVCRRKTNPGARILYYHRVNNENDPFFPAISTSLFEHEMRFAAKHYKVVTLSALLDHLQGGPAEDVLAITFDDGYRDNYENAFPILQRYGLPATIFLTTGSIDSCEPMWFEQLALALKKTPQEFIDLEIDLPRRFWLRTQPERLESNNRIFELLRRVDDADRRQWLNQILRQLRFNEDQTRKNKMLTWDQVRFMNAHDIDFGGHTVTHPFLARMTKEQVAWEVSECKRRIEQELQAEVAHFAYPNGREEDFGKWNKEVVRGAGYRAAVTTIWGMNYPSTDPMELRRGQPWEESPALFAYKLDWYQFANE